MKRRFSIFVFAMLIPFCFLLGGCNKSTLKYDPKPMPTVSAGGERLTLKEYDAEIDRTLSEKYTRNLSQGPI